MDYSLQLQVIAMILADALAQYLSHSRHSTNDKSVSL